MTGINGVRVQAALDYSEDNVVLKGFSFVYYADMGFRIVLLRLTWPNRPRLQYYLSALRFFTHYFPFLLVCLSQITALLQHFLLSGLARTRWRIIEDSAWC